MGPIAHLRLFCDNCGQVTNAFVAEDAAAAKVTCEHCQYVFDYVAGMLCEHHGYVAELPAGARIAPTPPPPQRSELLYQAQYADPMTPPNPTQPPPIPNFPAVPTTRAVSGWLIAWCIFCLIVHGLNLLGTVVLVLGSERLPSQAQVPPTSLAVSAGISCAAVVGLALILMARKVGFYLMCFVAAVALIANLVAGNLYGVFTPIGPLITWLLMRKTWHLFK